MTAGKILCPLKLFPSLGDEKIRNFGYFIGESCNGCGLCVKKCPQDCIDTGSPFKINQEHCLHCGNCFEVCPTEAVIKAEGI